LKYYVVRKGIQSGIFTSRSEVQPLVIGFPDAKYKSFSTRPEAEKAREQGREQFYEAQPKKKLWKQRDDFDITPFIRESIAVDAACS
jgi:ribonuclease HI